MDDLCTSSRQADGRVSIDSCIADRVLPQGHQHFRSRVPSRGRRWKKGRDLHRGFVFLRSLWGSERQISSILRQGTRRCESIGMHDSAGRFQRRLRQRAKRWIIASRLMRAVIRYLPQLWWQDSSEFPSQDGDLWARRPVCGKSMLLQYGGKIRPGVTLTA